MMPLARNAAPRDNASTEGVEETVSELWKTVSQRKTEVIGRLKAAPDLSVTDASVRQDDCAERSGGWVLMLCLYTVKGLGLESDQLG